jgi:hypothetical protein
MGGGVNSFLEIVLPGKNIKPLPFLLLKPNEYILITSNIDILIQNIQHQN